MEQERMKMDRPVTDEYPAPFERYVSLVPERDVLAVLERQPAELEAALGSVTPEGSLSRYAPDKWSIRQLVGHVADAERTFGYRAMCIARGDQTPLPGFEEDAYANNAGHDGRDLADILAEFAALRASHVRLLRGLSGAAWVRRGVANGRAVSVRAQAFIMAGHVRHHIGVLTSRYGAGAGKDVPVHGR